ncbi:uncharacterized protein LOC142592595 isoform X2 [Dermacentor variabilis]|uniref:uncharacterized protein LOC142592595 isoform X2 n=1 Tax=Dermacentor variabilis TaxID=34621 RepID=UPI003F5C95B8
MEDARPGPSGLRGRPRKYATASDARQARNEARRVKRREQGVRPRVLLSPAERMRRKVEEKRRWRESDPAIRAREAAAKRRKRAEEAELRKQQRDDARRQRREGAEARRQRLKEETDARRMEAEARRRQSGAAATNRFLKAFVENPFGSVCEVCGGLSFANDLTQVKAASCELLRRQFPTRNVAEFNVGRTCIGSLRQGKMPNHCTTNRCVCPPKPPHLPHSNLEEHSPLGAETAVEADPCCSSGTNDFLTATASCSTDAGTQSDCGRHSKYVQVSLRPVQRHVQIQTTTKTVSSAAAVGNWRHCTGQHHAPVRILCLQTTLYCPGGGDYFQQHSHE